MKYLVCYFCLVFLCFSASADLSGRVVDSQGTGIEGASVALSDYSLRTYTNSSGDFILDEYSHLRFSARPATHAGLYSIIGNTITFSSHARNVNLELFDMCGKKLGCLSVAPIGNRKISMNNLLPRNASSTLYLLKVTANSETAVYRYMAGSQRAIINANAAAPSTGTAAIAKSAASTDSLVISKAGYSTRKIFISNFEQDLDTIILSEDGEEPWDEILGDDYNLGTETEIQSVWLHGRRLYLPWGYDLPENKDIYYPVVVCFTNGLNYFVETTYTEYFHDYVKERQMEYPAFYTSAGHHYLYDSNYISGVELAEYLQTVTEDDGYRINFDRIYGTGWSIGGSQSYSVAMGLHDGSENAKGQLFAAFVNVSGWRWDCPDLYDAIVANTAVWFHLGSTEALNPIPAAEYYFNWLSSHPLYTGAVETYEENVPTGINEAGVSFFSDIKTVAVNGRRMLVHELITDASHTDSDETATSDPKLWKWMFSQVLRN